MHAKGKAAAGPLGEPSCGVKTQKYQHCNSYWSRAQSSRTSPQLHPTHALSPARRLLQCQAVVGEPHVKKRWNGKSCANSCLSSAVRDGCTAPMQQHAGTNNSSLHLEKVGTQIPLVSLHRLTAPCQSSHFDLQPPWDAAPNGSCKKPAPCAERLPNLTADTVACAAAASTHRPRCPVRHAAWPMGLPFIRRPLSSLAWLPLLWPPPEVAARGRQAGKLR